MHRKLKFRGWHTKLNRMISSDELVADQLTLTADGQFINVSGSHTVLSEIYPVDKFIPMQFTGLKDAKGMDIYEDDIVLRAGLPYFQVVWNAKGCGWSITNTQHNMALSDLCVLEVIGNIYENPELLEAK